MELHRYGHRQDAGGPEGSRGASAPAARRRLTLLLVIAMLTTGLPGIAAADSHDCSQTVSTLTVEAIQTAVDGASGGDVICLLEETYEFGAVTLDVDRPSISIRGVGPGTVLNASGVSGYGIEWTANSVTLQSLTLQGPSGDAGDRYGIKIQPASDAAGPVTGVRIEDVTVQGSGRTEIDLHWTNGATLVDVTARGTGAVANKGAGVSLTSATATTLTNLVTDNNGWGGVAAYLDNSAYFPSATGTSGLTITNHTSSGAVEFVPLYGEWLTGTGGGVIPGLVAPQYTHTVHNPEHRDDNNGDYYTLYYQNEATALAAAAGLTNADSSTVREGTAGAFVVSPSLDIQQAVDTAGADGVVRLTAGDFDQSVVIDNPGVTLRGTGTDSTISVPASGTGVTIQADGVTLEDLSIAGSAALYGINVTQDMADLTLDGVSVGGHNSGLKISQATDVDGLTVADSHFDGNTFGWYFANDSSADPTLVTDVLVTNTTFNNNLKKGIYVEKLDNAVFDGITVSASGTDAEYKFNNGIDINLKYRPFENITIRNSTVTGSGLPGAATASDPFRSAAIAIKARDDASSYNTVPASLTGVTLDRVTVSGGDVGVRFGEGNKTNAGPTSVRVQRSSLSGTSGIALESTATAQVDARNNWWGAPGNPGSKIVGNVIWNPACVNAQCTTPPPTPTPPAPPVTGDTPPPPPPVVRPPAPATPPAPITVPPGQSVQVPRGGSTAFVGGQPTTVNTVRPPTVPPPTQRTPQQVQQVQQTANQIVGALQNTRPSNATTPPPVTVTPTDTGANVVGLLSSPDGQSKPVPVENVVAVSAGNTTVLATGADGQGNPLPLEGDGTVPAPQGGSLGTAVGGLTPGSSGQIVAFSDPQLLGTFTADDEGLFRGEIPVPHWLEPGDHTLVINGQSAQGEITLAMSITVAASDVFSDVVADSTHALAISRLKALGISQGYGDGTFRPATSISRAQMAAFLARTLELDTDTATTDLSDVVGAHAGAIAAIVDAGVADGYGDGTFKPAEFVTRGQMATFLANAAGLDPVAEGDLSDVTGVHAGAINAVIAAGIANGHTDGAFRKDEYVNRAQMATFIVNLVDYLAEAAED